MQLGENHYNQDDENVNIIRPDFKTMQLGENHYNHDDENVNIIRPDIEECKMSCFRGLLMAQMNGGNNGERENLSIPPHGIPECLAQF